MHEAGDDVLLDDEPWLDALAAEALTPEAAFIAVDVSVRSRRSLQPLLDVWNHAQTPSRLTTEAPRWIYFTGNGGKRAKSPDQIILGLVAQVEAFDRATRRCWDQATSRTFDIGIQAGLAPYSFEDVRLGEATIKAVARIGAQIKITLYAPRRDE
jgi:hypothetical protein